MQFFNSRLQIAAYLSTFLFRLKPIFNQFRPGASTYLSHSGHRLLSISWPDATACLWTPTTIRFTGAVSSSTYSGAAGSDPRQRSRTGPGWRTGSSTGRSGWPWRMSSATNRLFLAPHSYRGDRRRYLCLWWWTASGYGAQCWNQTLCSLVCCSLVRWCLVWWDNKRKNFSLFFI